MTCCLMKRVDKITLIDSIIIINRNTLGVFLFFKKKIIHSILSKAWILGKQLRIGVSTR